MLFMLDRICVKRLFFRVVGYNERMFDSWRMIEMNEPYYKYCRELALCNELIEKYYQNGAYEKCFAGHLSLAEEGYPPAECQIGYFYHEGLGVKRDEEKALYWTRRAATHGDRDGMFNLAWFYEEGGRDGKGCGASTVLV